MSEPSRTDPSVRRVLAYVPDLMDRSRLSALGDHELRFVTDAGELAAEAARWRPDVVVVDLGRAGVVVGLQAGDSRGPLVGSGSHVYTETLEAARAAGCHDVLPRSRCF